MVCLLSGQMEPAVITEGKIMSEEHLQEVLDRKALILTLETNLPFFAGPWGYPDKMKRVQISKGYGRGGVQ